MRLPLVYYGNALLRKKCEPASEITDEIRQLVQDMIETMDANKGVGLAAPQVGKLIRLFVLRNYIESEDGSLTFSDPIVYINPKITNPSKQTCVDVEGCLSIPGVRGEVERPYSITVEATNLEGQLFQEEVEGYNARVRMHENDHINGVLFVDRLHPHERNKLEADLRAIKKKYN